MSMDGQGTKRRRKIAENYNCLRVTDDRRQTDRQRDGQATANSEREREFTFAKIIASCKGGTFFETQCNSK